MRKIIIHAHLISLVLPPPPIEHDVTFNTIQYYTPATTMMTTTTATTGDFTKFDGTHENQQSCEWINFLLYRFNDDNFFT